MSEKHEKYAKKVSDLLENDEIRALVDNRNETIGKKIRESEVSKVPYMLIVGEQEADQNMVSVREHGGLDHGSMSVSEFASLVKGVVDRELKTFEP